MSKPHPAQHLERFIEHVGRSIAWLSIAMVLVMFCVVVLRFVFNVGWIWLQEIVNYLHAYIFMIGAAYTLKHNEHVRVDIFYRNQTPKRRALIDLLGTIFLLMPLCFFVLYSSWGEVVQSWQNLEPSQRTGGLPFAYILKTSMVLMPLLLITQGMAIIIKNYRIITGTQIGHHDG